MSNNIVQFNEEIIKVQIKEQQRNCSSRCLNSERSRREDHGPAAERR